MDNNTIILFTKEGIPFHEYMNIIGLLQKIGTEHNVRIEVHGRITIETVIQDGTHNTS